MKHTPPRHLWGGVLLWLSGCSALTPAPEHPAEQTLRERLPAFATAAASATSAASTAQDPQLPWPGSAAAHTTPPAPPEGPLTQDQAVRLSLQRSPALRALLAQSQAQEARLRASARPGLFGISLERLRRGDEVDVGRTLSLGLLDLLTWPWRDAAASRRVEAEQWQLTRQVLSQAQAARVQWVQAVAAAQRVRYLDDVHSAATTAAELARRMQAAGHFSAAQAAVHEAAGIEARLASTQARRQALAQREALVRLLGLQGEEARRLALPDRLPDVPTGASPWTPDSVSQAASQRRLDVRLAEARWQATRRSASANASQSVFDVEAGWQRNSATGEPVQRGPELAIRLVAIDFGVARRQATALDEQAALAQWQQATLAAESSLRERLADQRATLDTAQRAARMLGPVRQRLLGERLKQYNGMLIGPFELINEARLHTGAVLTALDALRDFWLADAALQAAIDGIDTAPGALPTLSSPPSGSPAPTEASH
ncbi:MAG: TolC family protein [Proteobacteria bacterium]|uniref:TolC family protein n=1 Tax=Aquabacterium sp. TaxID=1872578 RepID=UPI0035C6A0CD|nr:TolC family protein [Pseudomonadota bacterium]